MSAQNKNKDKFVLLYDWHHRKMDVFIYRGENHNHSHDYREISNSSRARLNRLIPSKVRIDIVGFTSISFHYPQ